jgi:hypothetical protein
LFLRIIILFGCGQETSTESANVIPDWLELKIDTMSNDIYYGGAVVYRYTWHNEYVYYIDIPANSCAYCEVYRQNGTKIPFRTDAQLKDFLDNKTDQVIIWYKKD